MLYAQQRHTLPSSRYGAVLDVIEATGWTWEQYLAQPADMITELHIRLRERARRANG